MNPRDATIVCSPAAREGSARQTALVWDEVSGWRQGLLVEGQQGRRTRLAEVRYIGGGVLPEPAALVHRARSGVAVPRPGYRAVADVRDGLDDALREIL